MITTFPSTVIISRIRPRLMGTRLDPFVNVESTLFNKPALKGRWRFEMDLAAMTERAYLDLVAFVTEMRANATCPIPLSTRWAPYGANGKRLNGVRPRTTDGLGTSSVDPAPGFTLRAPAEARDSYIDLNLPGLASIRPGHAVTLGGTRYHKVSRVTELEAPSAVRLSLSPGVREAQPQGALVSVDQLRCLCTLEDCDDVEEWGLPRSKITAVFNEAF